MQQVLWLGYNGLSLPFADVAAVLIYQPALDGRITGSYGQVPGGVRSVVVTGDGRYLPTRLGADDLRRRWTNWRYGQGPPPLEQAE